MLSARRKTLAPDDPLMLEAAYNLSQAYRKLDRDPEAEPLLRETLAARRRTIGEAHPETLDAMGMLADLVVDAGRETEARPLVEELIAGRRAGATGPNATPATKSAYARLLVTCSFEDLRDPDEALRFAKEASDESGGTDAGFLDTFVLAQAAAGQLDDAAATQRKALELLPADSPDRAEFEERLAEYLEAPQPR